MTRWWTCGCGHRQVSHVIGRPFCVSCGKAAGFVIEADRAQAGFDFGAKGDGKDRDGGNDEDIGPEAD
jgi:hypothetical protein